ncbi:hypothetical protein [Leifsonia poae]|nr:hypothetical protein [Leifsonia poae]
MTQPDLSAVRDLIDGALRAESGLASLWDPEPAWYEKLLTGVALAVGDDPVAYIDAGLQRDDSTLAFRIVVYTERALVLGTADIPAPGDAARISARLYPRRGLAYINITATGRSISDEDEVEWPGRVTVHVVYGSGIELTMPAGDVGTPEKRARFLRLLDTLRDDLTN